MRQNTVAGCHNKLGEATAFGRRLMPRRGCHLKPFARDIAEQPRDTAGNEGGSASVSVLPTCAKGTNVRTYVNIFNSCKLKRTQLNQSTRWKAFDNTVFKTIVKRHTDNF